MSSHYSNPKLRIMASASPTGSQCLPAVGTAWACQLKQEQTIVVCCLGDAALRQGEFYEAWCFALQEQLPIVFVVEDNGYGISTPTQHLTPWNIGALTTDRLTKIDGRDALAVFEAGQNLFTRARQGNGPSVLWMEIDRLWPHTGSDDHRIYRAAEEISTMLGRDPLNLLQTRLIDEGLLNLEEWEREQEAIIRNVEADYERAEKAPLPSHWTNQDMESEVRSMIVRTSSCSDDSETMLGALNSALHRYFETNENAIYFGEDVEDPKGGVFGLTKGLSNAFKKQVFNSPLAEATIVGAAVGLAVAGFKPVFEIQFVDFIGPALNQLTNQAATLRWRSADGWRCPSIFIMPCGGYLPAGGPWHSQSNEALFAHIPGLLVACPSTPHDAVALFEAACQLNDPVIFLLPKHLLRRKFPIAETQAKGFGVAAFRRHGEDVTLVAWGNCVEVCLSAAKELENEGVSAEVLDLRTLVPCDWDAIQTSLEKTGRLVVVQEDNVTCGFGQSIIARATTDLDFWNQLASSPQLVARADTHIPFNPSLEIALLPTPEDVKQAVIATLTQ